MITPLPTVPQRSDGPATFADRADTFLAALPEFVTQANALEVNVNSKEESAAVSADTAASAAISATSSSSISAASAAFLGNWSALSGALAMPASVFHNGSFWALNTALANVTTATPGISASWTRLWLGAGYYTYANRADLRSKTPFVGESAIVEGLGLFVWESGSTEPDDDESCFATASGCWLLQAASWDLIDAWQSPDNAARDEFDEDAASKILTGSATCAITSVSSLMSASFAGTVTGATVGDRVIATPPAQLGSSAEFTGQLSYHAWVSAADTVTIMLTNASAGSATTNAAIRAAWPITVIKS